MNNMETEYSNRELDSKFGNLLEHMKGFEDATKNTLQRIEQQTLKTNGSVANLKLWRAYTTGAVAVLTVLVLPILLMLIRQHLPQ